MIKLNKKYQAFWNMKTRYAVISGGRGSGKSYATSLWLANNFIDSNKNYLYLREYMSNASISIIPQFLTQVEELGANFRITKAEIMNAQGKKLFFRGFHSASAAADANLKSLTNLEIALIDEATEVNEEDFTRLDLSLRDKDCFPRIILVFNPSYSQHWIYQRFFKDVPYDFNGVKNGVTYVHTTFEDNIENLAQSFLDEAERVKNTDLRRYANIFLGEWRDASENALFNQKHIELARIPCPEKAGYTVIAIDPAVTSTKTSDETAICLAAKAGKHYIIKEMLHGKWTPMEWASKVKEMENECSEIIYESNQGGDLIKSALENAGCKKKITAVHASKGKLERAAPIEILYSKGLVHHEKEFFQLEKEMTTYSGNNKDKSPNCLDAMVWAVDALTSHNSFVLQWG